MADSLVSAAALDGLWDRILITTRHSLATAQRRSRGQRRAPRQLQVILVTVAFGAGAMMLHSWLVVNVAVRAAAMPAWDPSSTFAFRAEVHRIVNLVLLGLLVLAALARAQCWRVLIPIVPGIALACLYGLMAVRSFTATASAGDLTFAVPLPWADVAAVGTAALLVILLVIEVSILLQRSSTDPSELRAD